MNSVDDMHVVDAMRRKRCIVIFMQVVYVYYPANYSVIDGYKIFNFIVYYHKFKNYGETRYIRYTSMIRNTVV